MNPYDPPADDARSIRRPRWIRNFLILNAVLVAIPIMLVVGVTVLIWIQIRMATSTMEGDPVTHQVQFTGFTGPIWPLAIFFLVPNVLLLLRLLFSQARYSRATRN
ncbi:MAG: hypothetical protein AAFX06_12410 [Planctomycetota bacterium]